MSAAATATTVKQPNFFELSGGKIKMSYSSTSFGGRPLFHYEDGNMKKDFTGDQIRTEKADLGDLVSVTVDLGVDRGPTTFTVLIPQVNLKDNGPADVETDGITTVHRRGIPGPTIFGQTDTYTVQALKGTGKFRID
jgi:hypothetical protein